MAQVAGGVARSSPEPPDRPTTHLPTVERCSSLIQLMYKKKSLDQDFLLEDFPVCFPSATLSHFYLSMCLHAHVERK